ncbi:MAG: histidine phosphatase family protein [Eubacteriales bacterium]|nr:histidine phosphatase family protein [Eubacteriales bacterium]
MKLLIVRHGDPDYFIDSLTPKGWREVEYLAERLSGLSVKEFYVSPKGRAKDTAAPTLKKMGRTAIEKEWLREFEGAILRPDADGRMIAWDWLPQDWMSRPILYDKDHWMEDPIMEEGGIRQEYEWVTEHFDELLAEHGYVREGNYYRVQKPNNDTIVFFCHFGLECILLSHLLGISPMVLWHGCCAAPSSVTTVTTEERRKGIASFRMNAFGDISHLYVHGEEPAFAARFCECYDNDGERRD